MKNQCSMKINYKSFILLVLLFPLIFCWIPESFYTLLIPSNYLDSIYISSILISFRGLCNTLLTTLIFSLTISIFLGFFSVYSKSLGNSISSIMKAIESIPSILIALFCYAPVSGVLIKTISRTSSMLSLFIFVLAATATVLPEAIRSITLPLSDLYNRKYSISFRSYGFTKKLILFSLIKSKLLINTIKRVAAGILLKTLVLDTSFGYVIQVGLGSTGIPQHTSPGALIAANRKELLFGGNNPQLFWIPSVLLIMISISFIIILNYENEE